MQFSANVLDLVIIKLILICICVLVHCTLIVGFNSFTLQSVRTVNLELRYTCVAATNLHIPKTHLYMYIQHINSNVGA